MSAHEDEHRLIEDIIAEFRDDPALRREPGPISAGPVLPEQEDLEALLASVRAMTEEHPSKLTPEKAPSVTLSQPEEEAPIGENPPSREAEEPPSPEPSEQSPATLEDRLRARNIQVETLDLSVKTAKHRAPDTATEPKLRKERQPEPEEDVLTMIDTPNAQKRAEEKRKKLLVFPQRGPAQQQEVLEAPAEEAAEEPLPSAAPAEREVQEQQPGEHRAEPQKKRRKKVRARPEPEEETPQEVAWEAQEDIPQREAFDPERPARPHLPYDLLNRPCEDPAQMSQKLRKRLSSIAVRMLLTVLPMAAAVYMTGAVYRSWPMPMGFARAAFPGEYGLVLAGWLLLSMVLCHEVVFSGLWRLLKGRPTLDSLAAFSCALCLADCILPYFQPQWQQGVPCACVNIVTCFFAEISKWQRYEALRRNYKSVAMGASPMSVKLYSDGNVQDMAIKTQSGVNIEPEELSDYDFTERFACYYSPVILVLAAAMAFSASIGKGEVTRLLWSFSGILSVSAPMCLLLSSSAGAKSLGKKLYTSGSLLINASKAGKLARCRAAALRDADLFPAGTVAITGMKAADGQSVEELLGCTASLLQEVGGGLGKCFVDFARQQYIVPNKARELRFFDTRGICATVSGRYVQVGTATYLTRSGIHIDFGQKVKNNIFIAINSQFAGVFSLRYKAQSAVYGAFGLLKQSRVRPVLALRDMFQTQSQIESLFDLRRGSTWLPALEERLDYSDGVFAREEETLALLFRDGLMPLAETISAAKKWKKSAAWGCTLGTICALCGMMILTFLAGKGAFAAADPCNILLYLLLWSLPVKLIRGMITKN